MNFPISSLLPLVLLLAVADGANAGLLGMIGHPACQTACNGVWVTCLATTGVVAASEVSGGVTATSIITLLYLHFSHPSPPPPRKFVNDFVKGTATREAPAPPGVLACNAVT